MTLQRHPKVVRPDSHPEFPREIIEHTQLGLLRHGDCPGIALMAVGLAAFQTVLDDGNFYNS